MTADSADARPAHLQPRLLLAVGVGGAAGTAARMAVAAAIPSAELPLATLLVNLAGAFALGALLAALPRRGSDTGSRRTIRLLLGTGFLGGFTTYSQLALDTVTLLANGAAVTAGIYLALTLALGIGAAAVGAASTMRRQR